MSYFRSALPAILLCATQALAQTPPPRREVPVVVITPPGPSTKAGLLTCSMGPSVGFIVGGRQILDCQFVSNGLYPPESYLGQITTIGLDIGASSGGAMAWAVFMPTRGAQYGSLAGQYGGVTADVAVGVGVGGGGSDRSVTLQPFSVEGSVGINLAVGVSDLILLSVEPPSKKLLKQTK